MVLLENGIEDALLEAGVELVGSFDATEDAGEEVYGAFLHGRGDGAVGVVGMDVAGDAAASEKGAGDEGGDDAIGLTLGVVGLAEELIEGGSSGACFAIRGRCGEGG